MSFGKELLSRDVHYSAWANRRLLEACSALSSPELTRNLGSSHSSILSTLCHIHDAERVWLACLQASLDEYRMPNEPAPPLSLEQLQQKWPTLWEGYEQWVGQVSEEELRMELYTIVPGGAYLRGPLWQILRHVLDHSILHRGQVVGMIRMLGHTPPAINRMDLYFA